MLSQGSVSQGCWSGLREAELGEQGGGGDLAFGVKLLGSRACMLLWSCAHSAFISLKHLKNATNCSDVFAISCA